MITAVEEIYGYINTVNPNFSDVAVSIDCTRIIYKCSNKKCKHVWAHEYRKVYSQVESVFIPREGYPIRTPAKYKFSRYVDGRLVREEEERECPECKQGRGTPNIVVGVLNEQHKCDARCLGAKGGDCECQCGGANHGKNHVS